MAQLARWCSALAVAAWGACADNPYVIGRYHAQDAGADAASGDENRCPSTHPNALFCSGFESPALTDEWDDTFLDGTASVERSTERAHSGMASLHASSTDRDSAAVVLTRFPAQLAGELHLRAHLYIPEGVETHTMNIMFIGQNPFPEAFEGLDINIEQNALQLYSPQANPDRQTGPLTIPRDRWFCLQLTIDIRDQNGSLQLQVDNEPALEATNIDTLPPEGITLLRLGIDWTSTQSTPFNIYADDVVLDTQPITCPSD